MANAEDDYLENASEEASFVYNIVASLIFILMSFCFMFPVNRFFPLDRRSLSLFSATLCYLTRNFLFSERKMNLVEAVDFDVLVLLAAIMIINFIMVHQKETKWLIDQLQQLIKSNPRKGFWMTSFAAFIVSPFLTNDGVCLLFVEPILNSFDELPDDADATITAQIEELRNEKRPLSHEDNDSFADKPIMRLERSDAFYFLISLSCSANIGSALCYTGNPQNMIVASDSLDVLPPYQFLAYMLLPSIASWALTTHCIQWYWLSARDKREKERLSGSQSSAQSNWLQCWCYNEVSPESQSAIATDASHDDLLSPTSKADSQAAAASSPSMKRIESSGIANRFATYVVATPFPFVMFAFCFTMIVLIFCNIMSISGLVCATAMIMVVVTVCGNAWTDRRTWMDGSASILTYNYQTPDDEDKKKNLNEFFEELFGSLDYSLLIIFLGTFIVIENINSTGLPALVWRSIVGENPFGDVSSVVGISMFVLFVSQFLGNVPIIQMAVPNVSSLPDTQKKFAWALISFVATIGGNLTLTGSAANIIVAEKAFRLGQNIKFMDHFEVCFLVTLFSSFLGMAMISLTVLLDSYISGN